MGHSGKCVADLGVVAINNMILIDKRYLRK
jgi:hypothetical protein